MGEHPHGGNPREGRLPRCEAILGRRRRRSRPAWRRGSKRGPRQSFDRGPTGSQRRQEGRERWRSRGQGEQTQVSSALPQAPQSTVDDLRARASSADDQVVGEHVLAAGNPPVGRAQLRKPTVSVGPEPLEPLPPSSPQAPCLSSFLSMPTSGPPCAGHLVPRKGVCFSVPTGSGRASAN